MNSGKYLECLPIIFKHLSKWATNDPARPVALQQSWMEKQKWLNNPQIFRRKMAAFDAFSVNAFCHIFGTFSENRTKFQISTRSVFHKHILTFSEKWNISERNIWDVLPLRQKSLLSLRTKSREVKWKDRPHNAIEWVDRSDVEPATWEVLPGSLRGTLFWPFKKDFI